MANVLIHLNVQDYAQWKPVFDSVASTRQASGSRGGDLYHAAGNPNEVLVLWDWDSLDNARKFFTSAALREAMQKAGVIGPPSVYYLDEIEKVAV